jgi:hypothetical protein
MSLAQITTYVLVALNNHAKNYYFVSEGGSNLRLLPSCTTLGRLVEDPSLGYSYKDASTRISRVHCRVYMVENQVYCLSPESLTRSRVHGFA